jgi:hypothetical protein
MQREFLAPVWNFLAELKMIHFSLIFMRYLPGASSGE